MGETAAAAATNYLIHSTGIEIGKDKNLNRLCPDIVS
jgi:hypothetical protein